MTAGKTVTGEALTPDLHTPYKPFILVAHRHELSAPEHNPKIILRNNKIQRRAYPRPKFHPQGRYSMSCRLASAHTNSFKQNFHNLPPETSACIRLPTRLSWGLAVIKPPYMGFSAQNKRSAQQTEHNAQKTMKSVIEVLGKRRRDYATRR